MAASSENPSPVDAFWSSVRKFDIETLNSTGNNGVIKRFSKCVYLWLAIVYYFVSDKID